MCQRGMSLPLGALLPHSYQHLLTLSAAALLLSANPTKLLAEQQAGQVIWLP